MAKRIWTEQQKTAIEVKDRSLLVSAAAGSGKTTVLIERIINRLTNKDNPQDILRLLVVTFTVAAAHELREKISNAITGVLQNDPANKHLQRQLVKLGKAKISTIHSFCYDLIRSNFQTLGLKPNVRMIDQTEDNLIMNEIMEEIIERFYSEGKELGIDDFPGFCDNFFIGRDETMAPVFLQIYNKLNSQVEGIELLKKYNIQLNEASREDFFLSIWGTVISDNIIRQLSHYTLIQKKAIEYLMSDDLFAVNYSDQFQYDLDFFNELISAVKEGYTKAKEKIKEYNPQNLGRGVKKENQTEEIIFYKDNRDEYKKFISKISNDCFAQSEEDISYFIKKTADIIDNLYVFLKKFEENLFIEKRQRNVLSFSDSEHLSLKLLYDNTKPSKTALDYRDAFDEVYIDEYQDVNRIQDMIFTAISKPNGKFFVGDIKQSIYAFRGAEPSLFSAYRDSFPLYYAGVEGNANTVFLSNNFRSAQPIVNVVNTISSSLFKTSTKSISYCNEDNLIFSKKNPDENYKPECVEISIVEGEAKGCEEADYIASEIEKSVSKGYKYKDITILLRNKSTSASIYENALKNRGIPYYSATSKDFFNNPEILLVICLLNCIDNPSRDIYLAGLLRSPLYGFSLDELIDIRLENKDGSLYDSLRAYTGKHEFPKGRKFLSELELYRDYSRSQPVDKLIWYLYRESGIMNVICNAKTKEQSEFARTNLMLIYDYSRNFEASSFKGLYNFIIYINDIIQSGESSENAAAFAESGDTVKIMTIHHSKGLEFPICFLCDTHRKTSDRDIRDKLLFDKELGIAVKIRDNTGFARYNTVICNAIQQQITQDNIDEEIRVLYVAMTRAIDKLYITASAKDPTSLIKECKFNSPFASRYYIEKERSYIKWVLTSLFADECNDDYIINTVEKISEQEGDESIENEITEYSDPDTTDYLPIFKERFDYKYPWQSIADIPSKLTVSELYPSVLDDEEDSSAVLNISVKMKKPGFSEGKSEYITGADRGTATHAFMQFCDFDLTEKYGVENELKRLTEYKFLSKDISKLVNVNQIKAFFGSELYTDMKNAKEIFREKRFNVKLNAALFTQDTDKQPLLQNEHILVQGVIDCFYINKDDELILVDYKTDYIPDMDIEAGKQLLISRHKMQLDYYRAACEIITKRKVKKALIYSFALNCCINI